VGDLLDNMEKLSKYYILIFFIIIFLMLSIGIINAKTINRDNRIFDYSRYTLSFYDQLDQFQINYTFDDNQSYSKFNIYYQNEDNFQWCAQSFKPNLPVLTKVKLLVYKSDIDCVLILSIKKELNGNDLVVMSKGSNEIPNIDNIGWITFDFPDINVLVNETYYIFVKCYCGYEDSNDISCYSWVNGIETDYYYGESWTIESSNSIDLIRYPSIDFCFETYGCSNRPPYIPKIEGTVLGNIGNYYEYTFQTSDPDNDYIYYCVVGGQLSSEICMGPYKSGEMAKATFSWQRFGTYSVRVKARDINGAESDWGLLEVKMPINYSPNFLLKYIHSFLY
jgi:hypothetical protein